METNTAFYIDIHIYKCSKGIPQNMIIDKRLVCHL